MCPDSIYGSTDDLELLQAERYDNSTIITFKRTLKAGISQNLQTSLYYGNFKFIFINFLFVFAEDKIYDQSIYTDGPQAILWAVGQLLPNRFAAPPILQSKGRQTQ